MHHSRTPGDAAELTFTGTGIEVLCERFKDQGGIEVFLDGQSRGRVNLKVENFPRLAQIRVFSAHGLPSGEHTLRLVNTTSDSVALDAFSVEQ